MACLVNGYGSKPAAGWSVGHQSADGQGFSLGNGDGYINFVASGSNIVQVYIMETITDGTTALAAGANRRSAGWSDGTSSTERQVFYHPYGVLSTNPHWVVAADEKTVSICYGGGITTSDASNAYYGTAHYFGRYINALGLTGPAEFVSLGGNYATGIAPFGGGLYGMALRNPFTGLIDQGASPRYGASNATFAGGLVGAVGKLVPDRLLLFRGALTCYGTGLNGTTGARAYAGQLRGLLSEPALCGSLLSSVLPLFGASDTWQSRVKPLALPGGKQIYPMFANSQDQGFFLSADPGDWS
ncbi:hypothetical protein SAMN05216272_101798 [Pseudomonas panipatensis]|uniref:Uncharacterized protein n=2 Tax=Pseudomonas panipatensis TaxID=428992 RepID=A0A1G8CWC1_9PSED|nr:hypothetical protein SAMN05216272_101798 [Pseudomonas panipatensis]SMP63316.1 hypothetical protein SAMN06295951_10644 [Pseudomonas panipatensis]